MSLEKKVQELYNSRAQAQQATDKSLIKLQRDLNKLTARERLELLFDIDSFVETNLFISQDEEPKNAGVITGYGTIDGRTVFAYAQDFLVNYGSFGQLAAKKISNIMDMAVKTGAPVISIFDSDGARLAEGAGALAAYGTLFNKTNRASGVVPQIALIMGPCTAGALFVPLTADFVIMSKSGGVAFLNPPVVLKAAVGEAADKVGTVEAAMESGIVHFSGNDDAECIGIAKEILAYLPSNNLENPVRERYPGSPKGYPGSCLPENRSHNYDIRTLIEAIADDGYILESQKDHCPELVTAFARMDGVSVGIVANQPCRNNGSLTGRACFKAARFIRLCDAFSIPIVTFVDTAGFALSVESELNGDIKGGAALAHAYSEASVPKLSLLIRRAYGSASIVMGSKSVGADVVLAWPTAEITPLSPETAVALLYGDKVAFSDQDPFTARRLQAEEYVNTVGSPYKAAKEGHIDDVIDPDETRNIICVTLAMLSGKRDPKLPKKHSNIPL